jgi:D-alanyl-D-alanine carboxypeptidase (penicillin-binding protein 5/6)
VKRLGTFISLTLLFVFSMNTTAFASSVQTDPGVTMAALIQQDYSNVPEVTASSAILIEEITGKIVASKNIDAREYPASTTKIMTALMVLENCNLTDMVTVGLEVTVIPRDSSLAALDLNEEISVETLLLGLLLPSGNDAAMALAVKTARVVTENPTLDYNEAIDVFVNLMNARAAELGLENTHFMNPHGYHDPNHYTSARDLAIIMQEDLKYPIFRDIISTDLYTLEDWDSYEADDPTKKMIRYWWNSNKLIQHTSAFYYPWAIGGKTGYTSLSQHCFVGLAAQNGTNYISVVLNAGKDEKWTDSAKLYEYGFQNYQMYQPVIAGQTITTVPIINAATSDTSTLDIIAEDTCFYFTEKENSPMFSLTYDWSQTIFNINNSGIQFVAPITQGDYLGTLSVSLNGELIQLIPLLAATTIPASLPTENLVETPSKDVCSVSAASPIIIALFVLIGLWLIYFFVATCRRRKRMKQLRNPYRGNFKNGRRPKNRY